MKKAFLFLYIFSFYAAIGFGEDSNVKKHFVGVNYSYTVYFANYNLIYSEKMYYNDFNYGIELYYSKTINKIGWQWGIGYSTKNYTFVNGSLKIGHKLKYINIPIEFNYQVLKRKENYFKLSTGLIINRIIDYYKIQDNNIQRNIKVDYRTGLTARFGVKLLSKVKDKRFYISIYPYIDYKLMLDYTKVHITSDYVNLTDDRVSVGFNFGLVYMLR